MKQRGYEKNRKNHPRTKEYKAMKRRRYKLRYPEYERRRKIKWAEKQRKILGDHYIRGKLRRAGVAITAESIERLRSQIAAKRFRRTAQYFAAAQSIAGDSSNDTH